MLGTEFGSARERRLLRRFRALASADRDTLEVFADFLLARRAGAPDRSTAPAATLEQAAEPREPRPDRESVVAAMKRLRRTYPEVDTGELFNEASLLMSAHLIQGRPAPMVIDDLEALFARQAGVCPGDQAGEE